MKIEMNDSRKHVIVWLRGDEDKKLAQPVIDKYRDADYLVVLFRSGKRDLQDETLSMLIHNREKCAEAYRARYR